MVWLLKQSNRVNIMKIEYKASVHTPAGHREVYVIANAKKISDKRCEVIEVLAIDLEVPAKNMSRTGANRQKFDGLYFASSEAGKKKNISSLFSIIEAGE
jgi:hypothetical protein